MKEQGILERLYTKHGAKRTQGQFINNKGRIALGYFEKGEIVGYTYLDEMMKEAYEKDLPCLNLDF